MSVVKQISRKIVLPFLVSVGADKYFLNKSKKSCCIVNFHGVRDKDNLVFNNRHIPVVEFEKIIKYLSKTYNVVPLPEIFEMHRGKKAGQKKTIALTFDDGYKNNFTIALPILKKYNVPATFYLISKGLVDDAFYVWPDKIDILKKNLKSDVEVNSKLFKAPVFYDESGQNELLEYLKTQGSKTELMVDDLTKNNLHIKEVVQNSPELIELIRKTEFEKYAKEPLIEYGSHTHSHPNLEFLNKSSIAQELSQSKEIIESLTGKKVISLAFPDGSYNSEVIKTASELGYKNQVAVTYKLNENNTNPDLLSRFTISNSTTFESNVIRLAKDFDKFGFN